MDVVRGAEGYATTDWRAVLLRELGSLLLAGLGLEVTTKGGRGYESGVERFVVVESGPCFEGVTRLLSREWEDSEIVSRARPSPSAAIDSRRLTEEATIVDVEDVEVELDDLREGEGELEEEERREGEAEPSSRARYLIEGAGETRRMVGASIKPSSGARDCINGFAGNGTLALRWVTTGASSTFSFVDQSSFHDGLLDVAVVLAANPASSGGNVGRSTCGDDSADPFINGVWLLGWGDNPPGPSAMEPSTSSTLSFHCCNSLRSRSSSVLLPPHRSREAEAPPASRDAAVAEFRLRLRRRAPFTERDWLEPSRARVWDFGGDAVGRLTELMVISMEELRGDASGRMVEEVEGLPALDGLRA
jgi:hypothetical protein